MPGVCARAIIGTEYDLGVSKQVVGDALKEGMPTATEQDES